MRQRYLRLISALLLLAVLAACGTDREGAAGGTVEGVVNRNGDFLVLLTDEKKQRRMEDACREYGGRAKYFDAREIGEDLLLCTMFSEELIEKLEEMEEF